MPVLESIGSASARGFGFSSGGRIAITATGTSRYLGYASNGLTLTQTQSAYMGTGGPITSWTTYQGLPQYLLGGVCTLNINDTDSLMSFNTSSPVRLYLLRRSDWNSVSLTGWTLLESGKSYISAIPGSTDVYYRDFAPGNHTGLDNNSAMYIWQVGTYIPYESPLTLGISGLTGWYDASTWSISGGWGSFTQTNDATDTVSASNVTKTIDLSNSAGSNKIFPSLRKDGVLNGGIRFPTAFDIDTDNYTLFHVTRRQGTNRAGRVFDGIGSNWLSGFHGDDSGVFYHQGWITPTGVDETGYHNENWAVYTDRFSNGRSNKIDRTTNGPNANQDPPPMSTTTRFSLHAGDFTQGSQNGSWACAEVLFFNRKLSDTEVIKVEDYLASKYGIVEVTLS
jgi:hypothetical protein